MPTYSVEIRARDSDLVERAAETVEKVAWTLNRPVEAQPGVWRFWFDGYPSTAEVEQALDEVDRDWPSYLVVGLGQAEAGS